MNAVIGAAMILFSVLVPSKSWYTPSQPIPVSVKSDKDVTLALTDFLGKPIDPKGSADVAAGASVDIKTLFPTVANPGTYVLYALPKGQALPPAGPPKDFLGTPLVIEVLSDHDRDAPPGAMAVHIVPLRYAVMTTEEGSMTMIFYYDVAPHTADSFLELGAAGYYDGIVFHRVAPGIIIQGGDPLGTGMGGPGYHIDAEFNDRPHEEGALSMARIGDPNEDPGSGIMPRAQYANSAGSQFFICLDRQRTLAYDHRYTVFGKVVEGLDTLKKIAAGKLAPGTQDKPEKPVMIQKVEVLPVTAGKNPYSAFMGEITTAGATTRAAP